jgi:hypothetical protein
LLLLLGLAALASCSAVRGDPRNVDADMVRSILVAHNEARRTVRPVARPPLPPVAWSEPLASIARDHALGCRFRHNRHRGDVGENLFATTVVSPRSAVEDAVESWVAERKNYTIADNRCAAGTMCGHYTQVIWRETRRVGCGVAACTSGSPFNGRPWTLVVCNYEPFGNIIGRKPY